MDQEDAQTSRIRRSATAALQAIPGCPFKFEAGEPQRVDSPSGELAYWMVPGLVENKLQAIARILPDGRVATVGSLRTPAIDCAQAVTGLSATDVERVTTELGNQFPGAQISEPILVDDGPVGREAWLYTLTLPPGNKLWVFATAGGTYSRPAGQPLGSDLTHE